MNAVKKFIVAMLVVLGLGIVFFIGYFVKSNANLKHDARNNTECKTNERVFDYADKLSDSEEETLRGEIAELEDKVGMDFVVVTMDQYTDLSEYDADAVSYDIESNTKDIAEKHKRSYSCQLAGERRICLSVHSRQGEEENK